MGMIDSVPNIWFLVLAFCFLKILLTLSPRHHSLSGGFVLVCYWCFPVKFGEILECSEYISPRESQLRDFFFTYRINVRLYFLPSHFFSPDSSLTLLVVNSFFFFFIKYTSILASSISMDLRSYRQEYPEKLCLHWIAWLLSLLLAW